MDGAALPAEAGARKRSPPPKRKPGTKNKCSSATISMDLRIAGLASFNMLGGIRYLVKVAKSNPAAYLAFMAKLIKTDDGGDAQGLNIIVQQINIGALPIPGVLNSPILEHVSPQRLLAANGAEHAEVADG